MAAVFEANTLAAPTNGVASLFPFAGPSVHVFDGLLPESTQSALVEAMHWMPVHFLNRWDRFKSHELDMHWYYPIAFSDEPYTADVESALDGLDDNLWPVLDTWKAIKKAVDRPFRLYECMLSANTFGTEGRVHQDIADPLARKDHWTALVYCNREWKLEWAGETLFFDERGEIVGGVMPKPGRIVVFSGDPPHVGRSVSRICPTDRRVLVYKFWSRS
jgi:SM-20-related protein